MIAMCSGSGTWSRPSLKMNTVRSSDDGGLSFSNFEPTPDQYLFVSDIGQPNRDEKPVIHSTEPTQQERFRHRKISSRPSSAVPFAGTSLHPLKASFAATNADDMQTRDVLDTSWVSPLQTRFNHDTSTYESYESNGSFSADNQEYSATPMAPTQWPYKMERGAPVGQQRRGSICSQADSAPCLTGRRRTSEKAEVGSARAVYLEKNRHAASKCRTKQKRQQEDLVETARELERKNKVLKSEVEFLKTDLRGLMELVGKHNECPDGRLRKYLQLEADRLSTQGNWNTVAELLSSEGSSIGDSTSLVDP
jgi:hypothetical protein